MTSNKEKIYTFVMEEIKHPAGCPKWARAERQCNCGLDEARELIKQERAGGKAAA